MIHLTDAQVAQFLYWIDVMHGFDILWSAPVIRVDPTMCVSRGINAMLGEE